MVKYAEAISEILARVLERDRIHRGEKKARVVGVAQLAARNLQSLGRWIDAVEPPDARRNFTCPAARAAPEVESLRVIRKFFERENVEIIVELLAQIMLRQSFLVKGGPF